MEAAACACAVLSLTMQTTLEATAMPNSLTAWECTIAILIRCKCGLDAVAAC